MALSVGSLVYHAGKPEWGLGKILLLDRDQAIVFFLDAEPENGAAHNPLTLITSVLKPSEVRSHPRPDNLPPLDKQSVTEGEAYVTLAQARLVFLKRFPKGFADPRYLKQERDYKWEAHEQCVDLLGRRQLSALIRREDYNEITERALRVIGMVNLPTRWDFMALNDGLKDPADRRRFAAGLFDLLHGEGRREQRFTDFARVLGSLPTRQSPVFTWPNHTILPFLFDPEREMFLKPGVTKQAANRCAFNLRYKPEPGWETYSQLLKLAEILRGELSDLRPRDNIDIQSFIWLVGDHKWS